MSKKGMEEFVDAVRKDEALSSELATLITFLAQEKGHDVDEEDVREFLNDLPTARPLPGHGTPPGATTEAVGEEDDHGRLTTEAVGEDAWDRHGRPSVTLAIGEEDGRLPPGATTEAVGEEGRVRPRPTTSKVGEEGGRMSTMAMGEERGGRGPLR